MDILRGKQVEQGLQGNLRVYLCGDLEKPSPVPYIKSNGYEIGISHYQQDTVEHAHYHAWNHEYNYVIEGELKVYVFSEKREYLITAGDLYVILPDMPYITKARAGTRVLFSKVPGGNDKILAPELEASLSNWVQTWEDPE